MPTTNGARAGPPDADDPRIFERLPDRLTDNDSKKGIRADNILGADLGNGGAFALVATSGDLLDVIDAPLLRDGPKGRPTINAMLLATSLAKWRACRAFVEHVGPRPGEGSMSSFSFGRARGIAEGIFATLAIPVTFITAPAWKRLIGIPPGRDGAKDAARAAAIGRWPDKAALFARKCDDGRAEACLIAVAGLLREARRG